MVVAEEGVDEAVMVVSDETVVVVSLEMQDRIMGCMTDELIQLVEMTEPSLASVTKSVVADKPDGMDGVLVEGEGVAVRTEIAASPPAVGLVSTERTTFGSGKVNSVDIFVDVVATELSLPGA